MKREEKLGITRQKLRQINYIVSDFLINHYKFTKDVIGYAILHRALSKGLNSLPLVAAHYNRRFYSCERRKGICRNY